jgi:hypothetical protein
VNLHQAKDKREEDSRRFPQRRNGVHHPVFGAGVVTMGRMSPTGKSVQVKFVDHAEEKSVAIAQLTPLPSHSQSPDPQTSRYSGYIGGNSYRQRG